MKLTKEENLRVEKNLGLIKHMLKKYPIKADDYDDYFQVGCYGLCLAAQRFDESKGFEFGTYAGNYIDGSIKKYYTNFMSGPIRPKRTKDGFKKPTYLYIDSATDKSGDDCSGLEFLQVEESKEQEIAVNLDIERIKSKLPKRSKQIIELSLLGKRQDDIANILGISQSYVCRIKSKMQADFKLALEV